MTYSFTAMTYKHRPKEKIRSWPRKLAQGKETLLCP